MGIKDYKDFEIERVLLTVVFTVIFFLISLPFLYNFFFSSYIDKEIKDLLHVSRLYVDRNKYDIIEEREEKNRYIFMKSSCIVISSKDNLPLEKIILDFKEIFKKNNWRIVVFAKDSLIVENKLYKIHVSIEDVLIEKRISIVAVKKNWSYEL